MKLFKYVIVLIMLMLAVFIVTPPYDNTRNLLILEGIAFVMLLLNIGLDATDKK